MTMIRTGMVLVSALALSGCMTAFAERHCQSRGFMEAGKGFDECVNGYLAEQDALRRQNNQDMLLMALGAAAVAGATQQGQQPAVAPAPALPQTYRPQPRTIMCADGSYVYGTRCQMAPDGSYVGVVD